MGDLQPFLSTSVETVSIKIIMEIIDYEPSSCSGVNAGLLSSELLSSILSFSAVSSASLSETGSAAGEEECVNDFLSFLKGRAIALALFFTDFLREAVLLNIEVLVEETSDDGAMTKETDGGLSFG